jgi:hypothetical protein
MQLVIDLSTGVLGLREPDEMKHFSVLVVGRAEDRQGPPATGEVDALAEALGARGIQMVDPGGDVLVPAAVVRTLAQETAVSDGQTVRGEWEAGFSSMVEYASAAGWTGSDGSLRAHVEWKD